METLQPIQSFGQKLTAFKFNPSGLSEIDKVKIYFADLIDDINDRSPDEIHLSDLYIYNIIKGQAIRQLTDACMWTVKFFESQKKNS